MDCKSVVNTTTLVRFQDGPYGGNMYIPLVFYACIFMYLSDRGWSFFEILGFGLICGLIDVLWKLMLGT